MIRSYGRTWPHSLTRNAPAARSPTIRNTRKTRPRYDNRGSYLRVAVSSLFSTSSTPAACVSVQRIERKQNVVRQKTHSQSRMGHQVSLHEPVLSLLWVAAMWPGEAGGSPPVRSPAFPTHAGVPPGTSSLVRGTLIIPC